MWNELVLLIDGDSAKEQLIDHVSTFDPHGTEKIESKLLQLPKGKSKNVRLVDCDADLRQLFEEFTVGGKDVTPEGYNGVIRKLEDGTEVGLRV